MIEKAVFISKIEDLKYVTRGSSRLYFGNEFCERRLPKLAELKKAAGYCRKHKLLFSLVTPYLTDIGLKKLIKLFDWLKNTRPRTEVIINDYGLLNLLHQRYPKLTPVLGRLLTKQKRDPRIASLINAQPEKHTFFKRGDEYFIVFSKKIPQELSGYFREANINVPVIRSFLKKYRIDRAEVDNLLQGIKLNIPKKGLSVSLYLPYGYITTTRLCSADPMRKEKKFFCRISSCENSCLRYTEELKNKFMPTLYKKGNTIFFKNDRIPSAKELIAAGINRIVYQPQIPL
jgi:hypothetical protein